MGLRPCRLRSPSSRRAYASLRGLLTGSAGLSAPARKSLERAVRAIAETTGNLVLESSASPEPTTLPSVAAPSVTAGIPEYLTTREAAKLLGVTVGGLEGMRANGIGPKYVKVGRRVRYRPSDLGLK